MMKSETAHLQDNTTALKNSLEQQIKIIMTSIKTQESERIISEDIIKADVVHAKENLHRVK
jgi:hypothetical protein